MILLFWVPQTIVIIYKVKLVNTGYNLSIKSIKFNHQKLIILNHVKYLYAMTHIVSIMIGVNECHLNIDLQHLTLVIAFVNERNGKSFGNVITSHNEQCLNGFRMLHVQQLKNFQ